LRRVVLPEPDRPLSPLYLPDDQIGWFVGLYLAEGSRAKEWGIAIASHAKEVERFERLDLIAGQYGSRCRVHYGRGFTADARISSKILSGIIGTYLGGSNAKTKHLKRVCWCRANEFLAALLQGYLGGDGHWESCTSRWRVGFTRNYQLANDLRTLCARLGYQLTLNPAISRIGEREFKTFRGEIRFRASCHHNAKDRSEVTAISKSKHRAFFEIRTADDRRVFALASGILAQGAMSEASRILPTPVPCKTCESPAGLSIARVIAHHVAGEPIDGELN